MLCLVRYCPENTLPSLSTKDAFKISAKFAKSEGYNTVAFKLPLGHSYSILELPLICNVGKLNSCGGGVLACNVMQMLVNFYSPPPP